MYAQHTWASWTNLAGVSSQSTPSGGSPGPGRGILVDHEPRVLDRGAGVVRSEMSGLGVHHVGPSEQQVLLDRREQLQQMTRLVVADVEALAVAVPRRSRG